MNNKTALQNAISRIDFWTVIKVICFVLVALFLIYPLFNLFKGSFQDVDTDAFTFANYQKLFSEKNYLTAFTNSVIIMSVTTIGAVFFGSLLAYLVSRYIIIGKNILRIATLVSLMSPPFIGAYSWVLMLGRNGYIRIFFENTLHIALPDIYGITGILSVFILKLFPFIFLYVSGALKNVDVSLEEAASGLGSSHIKKIVNITFPLITPTVLSGALLVSMLALADFGTPLLLGRGFSTLPVLIYDEFVSELGGNSYFASAISVVIVCIATALFLLQRYFVNKKSFEMSALRPASPIQLTRGKNILAHLYCYGLVFIATLPQLTIAFYSFKKTKGSVFKEGFSLQSYARVFDKLSIEIINTLLYSFIALAGMILLALFVSYLSVRRKNKSSTLLDILVMLPYIIPGTVIGIMYAVTFNTGFIQMTGTSLILIIVYIIRRGPNVIRSSAGILHQISPSVEEASISLGVSPLMSFFKITAVLMLPGIISGGLLAWIGTTSELSASIMLYVGKTRTIPVSIYSEIIYGQFGSAAAMSTVLVAIIVIVLAIFFKVSNKEDFSL